MVYQGAIKLGTSRNGEMHDLTGEISRIVQESGISSGIVNIFNVGSTGAIGTVEFEPGLERDIPEFMNKLIPPGTHYHHEQTWHDGNGHSHLQATLMGPSLTVPVSEARLVLGTWQQVFHLECDNKPHSRRIMVTVYGE
ncbi:secondary thiamine-phosphate synthase enzyme YjbQ [Acidobacteriota bacterium]